MEQLTDMVNCIDTVECNGEKVYHIIFKDGRTIKATNKILFNADKIANKVKWLFAVPPTSCDWQECVQNYMDAGIKIISNNEAYNMSILNVIHNQSRKKLEFPQHNEVILHILKKWKEWYENSCCVNPLDAINHCCIVDGNFIEFKLVRLNGEFESMDIKIKQEDLCEILRSIGCRSRVKRYNKKQIRVWQFDTNNL